MNSNVLLAVSVLTILVSGVAAAEPGDLEKYYPMSAHTVRWYAVKDVQSGATVDLISFAIVAKELTPDGGTIYLVENRTRGGISVDYQHITSEQVQLDRTVVMPTVVMSGAALTLTDVRFMPALPQLRAPVEVGRTWSETPQGDQLYTYRVESKFGVRVLGKNVEDCVRVVRTRGGTVTYKTEYCPGVGIAAIEILTGAAKWMRAELVAVAGEIDLIAVKSGVQGCEYIFDPLGPSAGNHTVTVGPPGQSPVTVERPANENIHVNVPRDANRGQWRVEIKDQYRTAFQTFYWSGACRADFLAPPPSLGPSLTLVREDAEPGRVTLTVVGVGWRAHEPLTLTLAGPGWNTQTSPFGTANAAGVSSAVVVPFADTLPRGDFTFTMLGTTQSATLTVQCHNAGFCAVKFWRRP